MISSDQIRAARALLRLEQAELAKRARVSASTIRRAEHPDQVGYVAAGTIAQVQHALEEAGVEFIHDGVRRVARQTEAERLALVHDIIEIARRSAAELEGQTLFTDDDLYDEHGLPK